MGLNRERRADNHWANRAAEVDRRTTYRRQLTNICGCDRCGDSERGEELAALITHSIELINAYETALMDGAR